MNCPHCNANLRGEPIPEQDRKYFGDATHFERQIGVEVWGVYDGILYWRCPDCGGHWHRWAEGTDLRRKAEPYVNGSKPS